MSKPNLPLTIWEHATQSQISQLIGSTPNQVNRWMYQCRSIRGTLTHTRLHQQLNLTSEEIDELIESWRKEARTLRNLHRRFDRCCNENQPINMSLAIHATPSQLARATGFAGHYFQAWTKRLPGKSTIQRLSEKLEWTYPETEALLQTRMRHADLLRSYRAQIDDYLREREVAHLPNAV
jgi:hypothetical protein